MEKNTLKISYKTINIDGQDIFYREAGDPLTPAILLLHGFPTSSFMFRNLLPKLADAGYHVIAPDYVGFGHSSMPKVDEFEYTFANLTAVIEKFVAALGLKKYSLYVQDYGSPIGFRLAVKHPERIQALIIQNGNAYETGLSAAAQALKNYGEAFDETIGESFKGHLTPEAVKAQYLTGAKNPQTVSPDTWTLDLSLFDRPGSREIQHTLLKNYYTNVQQYDAWHEYFRRFQPPTLVVWGKNDPIFLADGVENGYKKDLENIEVNYLDGGHFALEEYATEIADYIVDFLDRQNIR